VNRTVYNLAFYMVLPLIVLRLLWRALFLPAPEYARRWGERLGFVDKARAGRQERRWIWVHAASVGESVAISPLVKRLRRLNPHWGIVVTTMTPTGSERVRELLETTFVMSTRPMTTVARSHAFCVLLSQPW